MMFLNLEPLRKNRDFQLLYLGQFISVLGSMVSYVAIPYQVYQLTHSSLWVGALGGVQLVPVILFGLFGGSVADRMDRRRLLLGSEFVMVLAVLALALLSLMNHPSLTAIFALTFVLQAANGFHRPALEAINQAMVDSRHYAAIGALSSFKNCVGAIAGPALGGVLIAWKGPAVAYFVDALSFAVSLLCLNAMKSPANAERTNSKQASLFSSLSEGLRFALGRPELMGTYIVDLVAMTFAYPLALFPQMAEQWGGARASGLLFSAMAIGSLVITTLSGWTSKVRRHGKMVVLSAGAWGLAIIVLGYAQSLPLAMGCLILAGGADMISGIFRSVIWNETIPNEMRGRLAGIEMVSYMTGPLLGNLRAGSLAGFVSLKFSVVSGGLMCSIGVLVCAFLLPKFWNYLSLVKKLPEKLPLEISLS